MEEDLKENYEFLLDKLCEEIILLREQIDKHNFEKHKLKYKGCIRDCKFAYYKRLVRLYENNYFQISL
jgi:hypothetical protein